jgi:hypothetical protein
MFFIIACSSLKMNTDSGVDKRYIIFNEIKGNINFFQYKTNADTISQCIKRYFLSLQTKKESDYVTSCTDLFIDTCKNERKKLNTFLDKTKLIYPEDLVDSIIATKGNYLKKYEFYYVTQESPQIYDIRKVVKTLSYGFLPQENGDSSIFFPKRMKNFIDF